MKTRDDLVVGATMLFALIVVAGGAFWLSESHLGALGAPNVARFRSVGGLGVGNPVVLRGVRVGRVQEVRLGEGAWVEAVLQIYPDVIVPESPAIIAASASLFGEWQAEIINYDEGLEDPNVREDLMAAAAVDQEAWPGAALPDIGELTAQAGRIASDIASFSNRIETAFDEEAVVNLQRSIRSFSRTADTINQFAATQTELLGAVTLEVRATSGAVSRAASALERSLDRIESATDSGQIDSLVGHVGMVAADLRSAVSQFNAVMSAIGDRRESLDRIVVGADTLLTRIGEGTGTVGRLVGDSTLYVETTKAVAELRALIADIKENPRKYFKFSVF